LRPGWGSEKIGEDIADRLGEGIEIEEVVKWGVV